MCICLPLGEIFGDPLRDNNTSAVETHTLLANAVQLELVFLFKTTALIHPYVFCIPATEAQWPLMA